MASENSTILVPEQTPQCGSVHWMPFGIAYDGPVSTSSQYFDPQPQQQDAASTSSSTSGQQHWEAHFRGRQLKGVSKALPPSFQGLLLKPAGANSGASSSDAQQRTWQAVGGFRELVLWGHDAAPAAADGHVRCIDWLALADRVHQPVDAAAVEEELQQMQQQGVL